MQTVGDSSFFKVNFSVHEKDFGWDQEECIPGKGKLGITDKSRKKTRQGRGGAQMGEVMPESCGMNQSKIVISR